MADDRVARLSLDGMECLFEGRVGERFDLPAVIADQVVVVLTVGMQGLETARAGSGLDALEVALAAELVEGPVDAGDADASALVAELIEDLLGRQAAGMFSEELDHGATGSSVSTTLRAERGEGLLSPGPRLLRLRHGLNDSVSHNL